MKVYIASHCRWAGLYCANILHEQGHEITSRWLFQPFLSTPEYTEGDRQQIAKMDFDDVSRSEALLLVSGPEKYSGGKFVEAGIALALGLPITVLGRRENMLLWCPSIAVIDHPSEFGTL
jgi:hypothetical protein